MTMQDRVFAGIRATGRQHIGNYLGAIQNFVALQDRYECIYSIVDLHSLTTLTETEQLRDHVRETALDLLAAGIRPEETILYAQSHVPEISELHLLLSMVTPIGRLMNVPTFKEKAKSQPENVNYGLVGYPVLQTADIVLYRANKVPVGEDQLPHLELAREIVRRFNNIFGDTFPEPEAELTSAPMVLGFDNRKMSKSYGNAVDIAATPDETFQAIRSAITDPQRVRRTDPGRPEVCNVYTLHGFFGPEKQPEIAAACRSAEIGCVDCKKQLSESVNDYFAPIRERRDELAADPDAVDEILIDGARRARVIASEVLADVKDAIGLPASLPEVANVS
ncbi:MAG: tryptophan--tRNA ligase [Chloroflexi bacterium]|nr:tryptophan--tRNA ligase [Chloroflexota bacterium]MYF22663.1 tryptophan--tRNA ligase [Chloroflexota bacterium]